ncbi:hypothetical protein [Hyphomicrobium sp. 99]|uniref:hypothetical protein n=1 Tax=Hyphomicrobium sp. 99 TaxID=1163419 RepID=UPI000695F261|nr:hypothetical protein [Hyphomicrobium sp. 99]
MRCVHALTIYHIALLIEGYNPSEYNCSSAGCWGLKAQRDTAAVLTALKNAIDDETLTLYRKVYHEEFGAGLDYSQSLVHVDDLQDWMPRIGLHDSFFRPAAPAPDIQYPLGDFYAPKLAAAIAAWKAVTADPRLLRGKSPKKALEAWLRENAARYDLLNKDGSPNATGIEEISKVANWKPTGGAPATPEADEPAPGFLESLGDVSGKPTPGFSSVEDEETPF